MTKLTKAAIEKMTPQETMAAIDSLGLPDGSAEERVETLLKSLSPKAGNEKPAED